MKNLKRLLYFGVLFLIGLFVSAAIPAGKRAHSDWPCQWTGLMVTGDASGNMSALTGYEIGLRHDGIVIWRKARKAK